MRRSTWQLKLGPLASCLVTAAGCQAHVPAGAPASCPEVLATTPSKPKPKPSGCAICCDGNQNDDRAPRIRKARFKDSLTLELAFTERISDLGAVDPNQFRLSLAMVYGYEDYGALYYTDIGEYGGDGSGEAATEAQATPLRFTSLTLTGDGKRAELRLAKEIPDTLCEYIREYEREISLGRVASGLKLHAQYGLFLHYTHHGTDRVRDRTGNPLADVGGEWALRSGAAYAASYFTGKFRSPLGDLLEVPCPR